MNTTATATTTTTTTASRPASDEVTVLLSTFNGTAFLQQQLDSLYAQTYPQIRILARDDGSSDTTRRILEREQASGRVELLAGHDNMGAAASFFELLRQAARTQTRYVAFCDQDDVWLPEKLSRAVAVLSANHDGRAAMYCSRLEIVDTNLAHLGYTPEQKRLGFGNALIESVAVGCTIVLDRKAIDLICESMPARVLVHDWWCYLVLSCFGEVVFDRDALIKYRQHGNNSFGAANGHVDRLLRNLKRFAGRGTGRAWQSEQASVFMATFGDRIPAARQPLLKLFVDAKSAWWPRMKLALSNDIWRQRKVDHLAWRFLVLVNRF